MRILNTLYFQKDSNLKEGSQINNSTVFREVKNEVTEATGDKTVRHGISGMS